MEVFTKRFGAATILLQICLASSATGSSRSLATDVQKYSYHMLQGDKMESVRTHKGDVGESETVASVYLGEEKVVDIQVKDVATSPELFHSFITGINKRNVWIPNCELEKLHEPSPLSEFTLEEISTEEQVTQYLRPSEQGFIHQGWDFLEVWLMTKMKDIFILALRGELSIDELTKPEIINSPKKFADFVEDCGKKLALVREPLRFEPVDYSDGTNGCFPKSTKYNIGFQDFHRGLLAHWPDHVDGWLSGSYFENDKGYIVPIDVSEDILWYCHMDSDNPKCDPKMITQARGIIAKARHSDWLLGDAIQHHNKGLKQLLDKEWHTDQSAKLYLATMKTNGFIEMIVTVTALTNKPVQMHAGIFRTPAYTIASAVRKLLWAPWYRIHASIRSLDKSNGDLSLTTKKMPKNTHKASVLLHSFIAKEMHEKHNSDFLFTVPSGKMGGILDDIAMPPSAQ